jgi:small subunit ribosomal protein S8
MYNCVRADTITRIKNGYRRKSDYIQLRYSKETINFLEVLKEEGYIENFEVLESDKKQAVAVQLRYTEKTRKAALKEMRIVSKPGQRIYVKANKIPVITNGFGCAILSTNHGIITSYKAKNLKIGGEIIAVIF